MRRPWALDAAVAICARRFAAAHQGTAALHGRSSKAAGGSWALGLLGLGGGVGGGVHNEKTQGAGQLVGGLGRMWKVEEMMLRGMGKNP